MKDYAIKGLSAECGLKNVNFQEDVYDMVLETYCEESVLKREKYAHVEEGYIRENLQNTIIDMHGIKGASNGIGALELGEKFRLMEFAGKDGDVAYLLANMESCMQEYKDLVDNITIYLNEHNQTGDNASGEEIGFDSSLLDKMIQALDDVDFDTFEDTMDELLKQNFGDEINQALNKAWRFYDNFDYDEAAEVLQELKG